eukprot:m.164155 g.164155  ORF g.164155 m.164155 type:complete len:81 (+) comp23934_c0_seq11:1684-1926(+)
MYLDVGMGTPLSENAHMLSREPLVLPPPKRLVPWCLIFRIHGVVRSEERLCDPEWMETTIGDYVTASASLALSVNVHPAK